MEQVASAMTTPPQDHLNFFSVINRDGVFPPSFITEGLASVSSEDLKGCEVCMHRVKHCEDVQKGVIHEAPYFHVVQPRIRVNAICIKRLVVDQPLYFGRQTPLQAPPEDERPLSTGL